MADPLTDVQNAIWTVLNASSEFSDLVPTTKQKNLYGEGQKMGAVYGVPTEIDGVTVRLEPVGGDTHPQFNSCDSRLIQSWLLQVKVKDDRTSVDGTTGLLPTKWAAYRAMSQQYKTGSTIQALTFNDKVYVKDVRLMDHKDEYTSDGKKPGVWATAWRIEVEMHFTTDDLTPAA